MKRKSYTNYKKAQKRGKGPVGTMTYLPRQNVPYRNVSLQPEVKFFDTAGTNAVAATADWTGTEIPCDNYIQSDGTTLGAYTDSALIPSANGPGYGQVLGGKYRILKVRFRAILSIDASAAAADPPNAAIMSRVAMVMDLKAGGAQLQGEQVFTDMGPVADCCMSFQQQGQATDRYRILKDEVNMHQVAALGSEFDASSFTPSYQSKYISWVYTPKKPLIVNCLTSGATPGVAQLKDINIFILARTGLTGNIAFVARCYYTDT